MTLPQGFSDTEMLWVAAGLWLQSERIFVAMFFSDFPGHPYNVDLIWVPQLHVATKHFGVHVKGKFLRQPKKKIPSPVGAGLRKLVSDPVFSKK